MKTLCLMTLLVVSLPDTCISPCATKRCESRGKGGLFSPKDWNFFLWTMERAQFYFSVGLKRIHAMVCGLFAHSVCVAVTWSCVGPARDSVFVPPFPLAAAGGQRSCDVAGGTVVPAWLQGR